VPVPGQDHCFDVFGASGRSFRYISSGAFLTPLTPGEHTVAIGGIVNGAPVAFVSYNVTVSY
jgi:hypothetical protein